MQMKKIFSIFPRSFTAATATFTTNIVHAAEYGGGGLTAGTGDAGAVVGSTDIRTRVIEIVKEVLSYMALVAVVVIVIAGILMVISGGNDESKEKAKRIILYAIIGLIIILLAQGIVQIMVNIS